MPRFFVEPQALLSDGPVTLTGDDAHHIGRSLRMRPGESLEICDGEGLVLRGVIERIDSQSVTVGRLCPLEGSAEPAAKITVFQALAKGEKMDTVVQKCTELGAASIVPVMMRRCVVDEAGGLKKTERLRRIALEAAKQCGRSRIPTVEEPVSWAAALKRLAQAECRFVCSEHEHRRTLREVLSQQKTAADAAFLVGPEGGLDESELASLREAGLPEVTLGRRILRTETVAPAVTAILVYEFGEAL